MKKKYILTTAGIVAVLFLLIGGMYSLSGLSDKTSKKADKTVETDAAGNIVSTEDMQNSETYTTGDTVSTESQLAANSSGNGAFAETMAPGTVETIPETAPDGNQLYMADTSYDGKTDLSLKTFEYSFDKTSHYQDVEDASAKSEGREPDTVVSSYIRNKDFISSISDETLKRIKDYSSSFITDMFGTSYHTIAQDKDAYVKKLSDYFNGNSMITWDTVDVDGTDDYFVGTPDEYFANQAQWFIDNEVQADVKWTSDDSLIWSDHNYTYVRGELTIDPYSCKAAKSTGYMPTGVDYVNGCKVIIELQLAYYGGDMYPGMDEFQVISYDCLGKA